ncbi:MAG: magnesium transporter [Acidimicrobiales bacterium]
MGETVDAMPRRILLLARLGALLGPDAATVRQSLVALYLNSSTSFVAGAFLGSITGTLTRYPGLTVLVPAAIGLRGNTFGAFGNRISTSIHAGTFRVSARRDTVLGQNILASMLLTVVVSLALAAVAKLVAVGLNVPGSIGLLDLGVVSIVGGLLGSVAVLVLTVGLTGGAVRFGWDLDNVTAPLVSVLGDVLTLPALFVATGLLGYHLVTPAVGVVLVAAALALVVVGLRSRLPHLRRIVRESLPVLVMAGCISTGAGIALEKRLGTFEALPALLVLVPAHLSSAGALGGILSGRLSTKLFLGLAEPSTTPSRGSRRDIVLTLLLGGLVYLYNGVGAHVVARLIGARSPGLVDMVVVSLVAGFAVMLLVVALAYYATITAVRTGLDPDTYGIPIVSSSVDFAGAVALVTVITVLGLV